MKRRKNVKTALQESPQVLKVPANEICIRQNDPKSSSLGRGWQVGLTWPICLIIPSPACTQTVASFTHPVSLMNSPRSLNCNIKLSEQFPVQVWHSCLHVKPIRNQEAEACARHRMPHICSSTPSERSCT